MVSIPAQFYPPRLSAGLLTSTLLVAPHTHRRASCGNDPKKTCFGGAPGDLFFVNLDRGKQTPSRVNLLYLRSSAASSKVRLASIKAISITKWQLTDLIVLIDLYWRPCSNRSARKFTLYCMKRDQPSVDYTSQSISSRLTGMPCLSLCSILPRLGLQPFLKCPVQAAFA